MIEGVQNTPLRAFSKVLFATFRTHKSKLPKEFRRLIRKFPFIFHKLSFTSLIKSTQNRIFHGLSQRTCSCHRHIGRNILKKY